MRRFTPGRAVTIGEGTNLLYVVKESSGSLRLVRQGKGNLLSYAWLTKKKKRLSPINLTSYPFARKETFFRIFGQEGEEEFLSSIEITGYHAIHPQKFQDSWFVKRFSSILKFIYIHFLYIYIDETLGRNYFKQIIVSSIERARYHHTLITILLFAKNWTIEMCGFRAHSTAIQWSHDRASGEKRERRGREGKDCARGGSSHRVCAH